MKAAFTYEEAKDIAEDFSDLEGTGLIVEREDLTISCRIQKVTLAPYPLAEREAFIKEYKANEDAEKSLKGYTGNDFEVLLLATDNTGEKGFIVLTIQDYTHLYGIKYRYPGRYLL